MTINPENIQDTTALGQRIRNARKGQGLTQQELADVAGVGVRFLSELERGKESAEVGLVFRVVQALGYEVVLQRRGLQATRLFTFDADGEG